MTDKSNGETISNSSTVYRSAVLFAIQSWLAETPDQKKNATTPGYFSVGMALMALMVGYMPYFMPPPPGRAGPGTGTDAAPPVPPS